MASTTKEDQLSESPEDAPEEKSPRENKALDYRSKAPPQGEGFFHIYKTGQGYWTRMLTALGAGLLILGTVAFLYQQMRTLSWFKKPTGEVRGGMIASILAVVAGGMGLLAWRLMNKPTHVDFLIATDSEMKKVNWTSRTELMGSTKVVILFMFLIAFMLFAFDIFFGYLFKWITILKHGPLD